MTREEFLDEALNSGVAPSNFKDIYKKFCAYQDVTWNTLKAFAKVCDNNSIEYQMAYGSLLGIIRDKGQIPWDYDVDLFIHFEDRKKVIECLKKDLPDDYYFVYGNVNDNDTDAYFIRVTPKGYDHWHTHVDVFYYVGTPDDEEEMKKHSEMLKELNWKYLFKKTRYFGRFKYKVKLFIYKCLYKFESNNSILKKLDFYCGKYNSYTSNFVSNGNQTYGDLLFEHKLIAETEKYQVSDVILNIPKQYDEVLKIMYGDYNKYPPISNRICDVIKWYNANK